MGLDFEHLNHDVRLWRLNMRLSKHVRSPFSVVDEVSGLTFASGTARLLPAVERLHQQLFRQPLLGWLRWVYRFRAPELMTVALTAQGELAGYDLFMFNAAEVPDNIIHELYLGVAPAFQGQGLSTRLRRCAGDSYDHGRLSAISTLAARDDIKALRSAQKSGFAITKFSAKPPAHYLLRPLIKRQ